MQLNKDVHELQLKKSTLQLFPTRKTFYLGGPCTLFSYRFMYFLEMGQPYQESSLVMEYSLAVKFCFTLGLPPVPAMTPYCYHQRLGGHLRLWTSKSTYKRKGALTKQLFRNPRSLPILRTPENFCKKRKFIQGVGQHRIGLYIFNVPWAGQS